MNSLGHYTYLSLDELNAFILAHPDNHFALHEWFVRTQHIQIAAVRLAAR